MKTILSFAILSFAMGNALADVNYACENGRKGTVSYLTLKRTALPVASNPVLFGAALRDEKSGLAVLLDEVGGNSICRITPTSPEKNLRLSCNKKVIYQFKTTILAPARVVGTRLYAVSLRKPETFPVDLGEAVGPLLCFVE